MSTTSIRSIADIVRTHGTGRPNHPCLSEGDRSLTWAEMYERSQRVAQGFVAAGVTSGDRVALLDMNGIPHFEIAFGAAMVNAVSVDVNWRLAAPEVEYIVNNAEAKVLVVGAEFVGILDAIADKLEHTKLILVVGGHGQYEDWNAWVARQATGDPNVPSAPEDVAFQLYSSGTTGLPKGVMLTNNNFLAIAPMIREIW
jgi:long-chain acyl-CoA synthetase